MVKKNIFKAFALAVIIMFIAGFVFPVTTSLITEHTLSYYSNGQPVKVNGKVIDSYLLAEAFNESYFFQPRPSATNYSFNDSGSYSTSLSNTTTLNNLKENLNKFEKENNISESKIPYEMISDSGSGVDYAIPLNGAYLQINRIAESINKLSNDTINVHSIDNFINSTISHDKQRNFPVFGTYYVNVVELNIAIIHYMENNKIVKKSFFN